jgi:hypothetical protein
MTPPDVTPAELCSLRLVSVCRGLADAVRIAITNGSNAGTLGAGDEGPLR